jgi:NitT/TauT family transport system ATP-binding protein
MTVPVTSLPYDNVAANTRGPADRLIVSVRDLHHTYASAKTSQVALAGVDLDVSRREIVSIIGPSGAGKTTVLRTIAGLLRPTRGTVLVEGVPVAAPPRQVGVVFQDYSRSLLPWLTVSGNVELPLRAKGFSRSRARTAAADALAAVGLSGRERAHPRELSGGMQQRVAIARALAYEPDLLLMDEPFASVDAQTRMDLEDLVLPLRDRFGVSIVLVTHDVDEAIYLSDRVIALSPAPSRVRAVVEIGLAQPMNQITTKEDPAFARLRAEVLALVRRPSGTEQEEPR